ncbi:MAG: uroporphyrinogen-III synthase [Pyrinomonadaceae bacterium]
MSLSGFTSIVLAGANVRPIEPASCTTQMSARLCEAAWIVFASAPAVEFFFASSWSETFDLSEREGLGICSIGTAAAESLRSRFVHSDIVVTDGLAEAINAIEHYSGEHTPSSIVVIDGQPSFLPDRSETISKKAIEICDVYQACFADEQYVAKTRAMIVGGAFDAVAMSVKDLVSLLALCPEINRLDDIDFYPLDEVASLALADLSLGHQSVR